eukprot:gene5444-5447_t
MTQGPYHPPPNPANRTTTQAMEAYSPGPMLGPASGPDAGERLVMPSSSSGAGTSAGAAPSPLLPVTSSNMSFTELTALQMTFEGDLDVETLRNDMIGVRFRTGGMELIMTVPSGYPDECPSFQPLLPAAYVAYLAQYVSLSGVDLQA